MSYPSVAPPPRVDHVRRNAKRYMSIDAGVCARALEATRANVALFVPQPLYTSQLSSRHDAQQQQQQQQQTPMTRRHAPAHAKISQTHITTTTTTINTSRRPQTARPSSRPNSVPSNHITSPPPPTTSRPSTALSRPTTASSATTRPGTARNTYRTRQSSAKKVADSREPSLLFVNLLLTSDVLSRATPISFTLSYTGHDVLFRFSQQCSSLRDIVSAPCTALPDRIPIISLLQSTLSRVCGVAASHGSSDAAQHAPLNYASNTDVDHVLCNSVPTPKADPRVVRFTLEIARKQFQFCENYLNNMSWSLHYLPRSGVGAAFCFVGAPSSGGLHALVRVSAKWSLERHWETEERDKATEDKATSSFRFPAGAPTYSPPCAWFCRPPLSVVQLTDDCCVSCLIAATKRINMPPTVQESVDYAWQQWGFSQQAPPPVPPPQQEAATEGWEDDLSELIARHHQLHHVESNASMSLTAAAPSERAAAAAAAIMPPPSTLHSSSSENGSAWSYFGLGPAMATSASSPLVTQANNAAHTQQSEAEQQEHTQQQNEEEKELPPLPRQIQAVLQTFSVPTYVSETLLTNTYHDKLKGILNKKDQAWSSIADSNTASNAADPASDSHVDDSPPSSVSRATPDGVRLAHGQPALNLRPQSALNTTIKRPSTAHASSNNRQFHQHTPPHPTLAVSDEFTSRLLNRWENSDPRLSNSVSRASPQPGSRARSPSPTSRTKSPLPSSPPPPRPSHLSTFAKTITITPGVLSAAVRPSSALIAARTIDNTTNNISSQQNQSNHDVTKQINSNSSSTVPSTVSASATTSNSSNLSPAAPDLPSSSLSTNEPQPDELENQHDTDEYEYDVRSENDDDENDEELSDINHDVESEREYVEDDNSPSLPTEQQSAVQQSDNTPINTVSSPTDKADFPISATQATDSPTHITHPISFTSLVMSSNHGRAVLPPSSAVVTIPAGHPLSFCRAALPEELDTMIDRRCALVSCNTPLWVSSMHNPVWLCLCDTAYCSQGCMVEDYMAGEHQTVCLERRKAMGKIMKTASNTDKMHSLHHFNKDLPYDDDTIAKLKSRQAQLFLSHHVDPGTIVYATSPSARSTDAHSTLESTRPSTATVNHTALDTDARSFETDAASLGSQMQTLSQFPTTQILSLHTHNASPRNRSLTAADVFPASKHISKYDFDQQQQKYDDAIQRINHDSRSPKEVARNSRARPKSAMTYTSPPPPPSTSLFNQSFVSLSHVAPLPLTSLYPSPPFAPHGVRASGGRPVSARSLRVGGGGVAISSSSADQHYRRREDTTGFYALTARPASSRPASARPSSAAPPSSAESALSLTGAYSRRVIAPDHFASNTTAAASQFHKWSQHGKNNSFFHAYRKHTAAHPLSASSVRATSHGAHVIPIVDMKRAVSQLKKSGTAANKRTNHFEEKVQSSLVSAASIMSVQP